MEIRHSNMEKQKVVQISEKRKIVNSIMMELRISIVKYTEPKDDLRIQIWNEFKLKLSF